MRKTGFRDEDVVACYEHYERIASVSKEFGIPNTTVWRILKRNGVQCTHRHEKSRKRKPFPSHCKTKYCHAFVCALAELDYSHSQIADIAGVPIASVCDILHRKRPELFRAGSNHQQSINAFLVEFPDRMEACKSIRRRAAIRRQYRIASRPHDGPLTGLTWQDIASRNGGNLKCWICGDVCDPEDKGDKHPSIDHIIPLSNGGTDTYDNVRIACLGCNRDRGNRVQLTLDYLMYESR